MRRLLTPLHCPSMITDLEIDALTLKMTFYHQNSSKNGIFTQSDIKRCATLLLLFVFVEKHIFTFLTLELTFHDFELNLTMQMTSNHQSNTLNGFSSQNPMKMRYLGIVYFLEKSYLTLKLTFALESTKLFKLFKLALIGFSLYVLQNKAR